MSSTSAITSPTLDRAIEGYLSGIRQKHSPQTSAAFNQALHLFERFLHQNLTIQPARTPASAARAGWAKEFLRYLQENHSVETEHLYSRAILNFYQYLEDEELAPISAETLREHFTTTRRRKEHTIPTPPLEAIEQILSYARHMPMPAKESTNPREYLRLHRDRAFILTLAETGLRVSEICALRRRDVDLERRSLTVSARLELPLSPTTATSIRSYLEKRAELDQKQRLVPIEDLPLFARHDKRAGKRVLPISRWTGSNIVEQWVRLALPAKVQHELEEKNQRITPKAFRHYFVITTLKQTGDLAITQMLARHMDRSTTRRYLRSQQAASHLKDQETET